MANKKPSIINTEVYPMLKTIEQMSRKSGIGENKLRELVDNGEIEYIQNGNRKLLADKSIWDWFNTNSIKPTKEII